MVAEGPTRAADARRVTFYTVADAAFFPGVVALINSLRLVGHSDPVVVADLGLLPEQRARLETVADVVTLEHDVISNPTLYKAYPHALGATGRVVTIDSDMIVTCRLDGVVDAVDDGRVCMHLVPSQPQRFFPEWAELFGLRAPLRPSRYLNAGVIAFDQARWPDLLPRWWEMCMGIPREATRAGGAPWEAPTCDADQDALNALLMSEVPAGSVALRRQHVVDELLGVRLLDPLTLRCTDGAVPCEILHHTGGPKPWQPQAWMRVRRNAYVRLLPRLLLSADVALTLRPDELPVWLHDNARGRAVLRALDAVNGSTRAVVRRTPRGVYQQLRRLRARLAHEVPESVGASGDGPAAAAARGAQPAGSAAGPRR